MQRVKNIFFTYNLTLIMKKEKQNNDLFSIVIYYNIPKLCDSLKEKERKTHFFQEELCYYVFM